MVSQMERHGNLFYQKSLRSTLVLSGYSNGVRKIIINTARQKGRKNIGFIRTAKREKKRLFFFILKRNTNKKEKKTAHWTENEMDIKQWKFAPVAKLLKTQNMCSRHALHTIKSQNVAKPHSSGEETLWHNGRTCPDSGLHCGIGSHCLTDSCRKNKEEEEETREIFGSYSPSNRSTANCVRFINPEGSQLTEDANIS